MRADQPEPGQPDEPHAPGSPDADGGSERGTAREAEPASRSEQVTAHLEYRETVTRVNQAAADQSSWRAAAPELRSAWTSHKERYPERAQAAARTETDGSWTCGEHRRLDPEQNTEAGKAHADLADEASRHILPALRRVEAADPDRRLAGLEHMVKGEDRLKEKMADYLRAPGTTVREALEDIPDGIRFTLCYPEDSYSNGVLADVDHLKSEGLELIKLKNLWHADQYKGVNSQWRSPETGSRFEVQFHTPESLVAKEFTHEAYERIRSDAASPEEQRELKTFQRQVNALVTIPEGTERIKDYPEKSDGRESYLLRTR
jgi:hypothetical protein